MVSKNRLYHLSFFLFCSAVLYYKITIFYNDALLDTWIGLAATLSSFFFELAPLFFCFMLSSTKSKPIIKSCRFILVACFFILSLNILYYIFARENVSVELLRNINLISINGFLPRAWHKGVAMVALIFLFVTVIYLSDFLTKYIEILPRWLAIIYFLPLFFATAIFFTVAHGLEVISKNRDKPTIPDVILEGKKYQMENWVIPSYINTIFSVSRAFSDEKLKLYPPMHLSAEEEAFLEIHNVGYRNKLSILSEAATYKSEVASTPPNKIIIIAVESLALSYLHKFNNKIPSDVTPYLNKLIDEVGVFENFYTAGIPTDHGLSSLLCAYPNFNPLIAGRLKCIPRILRESGYSSSFYRAVSIYFYNHNISYKPYFGFDQIIAADDYKDSKSWAWGVTDDVVFDRVARDILSHRDRKELLVVNTADTHPPYYIEDSNYDHSSRLLKSLNTIDNNLKKFIGILESDDELWSNALIIITSDHSPSHGEYLDWTGHLDYEPEKIPLIFMGGSNYVALLNKINKKMIYSQLDLMPTLAFLFTHHDNVPMLGGNMFEISLMESRSFVPLLSSKAALVLKSVDETISTGWEFWDLNEKNDSLYVEAIKKHTINSFFFE